MIAAAGRGAAEFANDQVRELALGHQHGADLVGVPEPFQSLAKLEAFFAECDSLEGPELEPEWEDHLRVISESRGRGASNT